MNRKQAVELVVAMHKAEALAEVMVYEVWEDGEITLTKGGDLYGRRNLHCISFGKPGLTGQLDGWPPELHKYNTHARIAVLTNEDAMKASNLLCEASADRSAG